MTKSRAEVAMRLVVQILFDVWWGLWFSDFVVGSGRLFLHRAEEMLLPFDPLGHHGVGELCK